MQAVLLAAGRSSRFAPFSDLAHKSCVQLMGKPLIQHTIEALKNTGIENIVVVVSVGSEIPEMLGDGGKFGVILTYVEQKNPHGMGDAILAARDVISDHFFLMNPYHVDFPEFKIDMEKKLENNEVVMLAQKTSHITHYGSLSIDGDRAVGLVEKPESLVGDAYRVVGIYLLNKEFLKLLEKTPLEEYQFERALNEYMRNNVTKVVITDKENVSLKYAWNLLGIKDYLLHHMRHQVSPKATVSQNVIMQGNIVVEDGATIYEGAILKGPIYIGKNVVVGNFSLLRNGVILEDGAKIGSYCEVKNSIVGKTSSCDAGIILDSIIADDVKIGARFCSTNVRLKRDNITVVYNEKKVDTGLRSFGVVIGRGSRLGSNVTTMPGTIIGFNSLIGPCTFVKGNVANNTKIYAEFNTVRLKNS